MLNFIQAKQQLFELPTKQVINMADKTKIEWTRGGATWNPIIARRKDNDKRGWFCTKPSTGCKKSWPQGNRH